MRKLWDYKFQLLVIGLLLFAIMSSRGGLASLMPFLRFLVPVIIVVLLFQLVKKKLMGSLGDAFKKQMEAAMNAQKAGGQGQKTIQLCSKCGGYATPGHRCKAK